MNLLVLRLCLFTFAPPPLETVAYIYIITPDILIGEWRTKFLVCAAAQFVPQIQLKSRYNNKIGVFICSSTFIFFTLNFDHCSGWFFLLSLSLLFLRPWWRRLQRQRWTIWLVGSYLGTRIVCFMQSRKDVEGRS